VVVFWNPNPVTGGMVVFPCAGKRRYWKATGRGGRNAAPGKRFPAPSGMRISVPSDGVCPSDVQRRAPRETFDRGQAEGAILQPTPLDLHCAADPLGALPVALLTVVGAAGAERCLESDPLRVIAPDGRLQLLRPERGGLDVGGAEGTERLPSVVGPGGDGLRQ